MLFYVVGRLSLWSLQKLLTGARFLAYHTPSAETGQSFLQYDKLTANRYTFMASARTHVTQAAYAVTSDPPQLEVEVRLGYVGTSSLSSVAVLVDRRANKEWVRNINQVVTVDKSTRRPVPLPEWWTQQYAGTVTSEHRCIVAPMAVPDDRHCYPVIVPWSDIDRYQHTNYTAYLRYCMDAAHDGAVALRFRRLREDLDLFTVKEVSILYRKESRARDALEVGVWESHTNPFCLHFDITKQEDSIFQATIEFHNNEQEHFSPDFCGNH